MKSKNEEIFYVKNPKVEITCLAGTSYKRLWIFGNK